MPISLNPGIRTLILKYNDFHVVDASFQFYPKLELVDLSHNSLVIVPSKAFKSQRNLLDLRLNDNKVKIDRYYRQIILVESDGKVKIYSKRYSIIQLIVFLLFKQILNFHFSF